jgi:hypothetical protein
MKGSTMERLCAAVIACSWLAVAAPAGAHSTRQSEESVVAAASVVGASAGLAVAMPVALLAHGGTLVVKGVEASAHGLVCVLERVSDGARASVKLAANGAGKASIDIGTVVTTTVTASGVVLSAAGEAIAFIPNQLGLALLHDERLTR